MMFGNDDDEDDDDTHKITKDETKLSIHKHLFPFWSSPNNADG